MAAGTGDCTWSAIRPVTGACLLLLIESGAVGLDDPVSWVWPELGDNRVGIRHLLTHIARRITVPPVPLTDWPAPISRLAAAPTAWPPRTVVGEHALEFGHLIGEVLRRLDGPSFGRLLAKDGRPRTSLGGALVRISVKSYQDYS